MSELIAGAVVMERVDLKEPEPFHPSPLKEVAVAASDKGKGEALLENLKDWMAYHEAGLAKLQSQLRVLRGKTEEMEKLGDKGPALPYSANPGTNAVFEDVIRAQIDLIEIRLGLINDQIHEIASKYLKPVSNS